jgi:LysR family transcriptional regulator, cell division regulator
MSSPNFVTLTTSTFGRFILQSVPMDIDDLKLLKAVAKNGSMSRAAVELHMVQSNVTARVRQLEESLGVSLFVRHSRGVTLNEAGRRLLSYASRIDNLFHEAIAAVKERGSPSGTLRLGALEQTLSTRLARVLEQYTVRYPSVSLTMTTGNSLDLIGQVLDQELEGAFVRGPVNQHGLSAEPIFWEELVLVTGPSIRCIEDLQQVDVKAFVLAQGCSYREALTGILERSGIKHQIMAVASFDAIRSLVQSNVGVTLLPKAFLTNLWKDAAIAVHQLAEGSMVETAFVTRTDQASSSALDAFLSLSRMESNITD